MSNNQIDESKFCKAIHKIINGYQGVDRINFRNNTFLCDPLDVLDRIFTKRLPERITVDLRKNTFQVS